ncbi:MAG: RNA polymerase subunit sigma [Lachnospiraceae bacterium]|nr:RNA polymerase subunit sigma [Lachnospiraceae bacterium]
MDEFGKKALEARADKDLLNRFIGENKKFIISAAYKTLNRFVSESDDEYSIALIAFSEAIDSYDDSKGAFSSFASLIIKRRLIDYIRSNEKFSREVSVEPRAIDADSPGDDEITSVQLEIMKKTAESSMAEGRSREAEPGTSPTVDEINAISEVLKEYGIEFSDLAESSPHAEKTKKACAIVVCEIFKNKDLYEKMKKSHSLPVSDLKKLTGVKEKILERHRKYIIAASEILTGEYPIISEYLRFIKEYLNIDSG